MRTRHTDVEERDSHAHEVAGEQEVVETHAGPWSVTQAILRTIASLVAIAIVAVETLLAFRFAFLLAGANPSNGFVDFIYDVTGWITDPFEGIVSTDTVGNDGVFDPATLIAMAVVAAVGIIILMTLWAISSAQATGDGYSATRTRHDTSSVHED